MFQKSYFQLLPVTIIVTSRRVTIIILQIELIDIIGYLFKNKI